MAKVLNGIDRIGDYRALLAGKRLGLITGASGISADGRSSIDVLRGDFRLSVLFAPEHGVRGEWQPGKPVASAPDPYTGIPVVSLFPKDTVVAMADPEDEHMPTPAAMDGIDLMLFDIQDAGARFFTFSSTLYYAIMACGRANKPLLVLDRPNPIDGNTLEGPLLRDENRSFIGLFPSPIRHGLTVGELARYFIGELSLSCELHVAQMSGWRRDMLYTDTGLPFVNPSVNLPSMDALLLYCGVCLLAGTNLTEGRGTTNPFTQVGAPYIEPDRFAARMNALGIPGVLFSPSSFIPMFSKYANELCGGVRIHVTEPRRLRSAEVGVKLIKTARELYPDRFTFVRPSPGGRFHADLDVGDASLRDESLTANELLARWDREAESFRPVHDRYLLY